MQTCIFRNGRPSADPRELERVITPGEKNHVPIGEHQLVDFRASRLRRARRYPLEHRTIIDITFLAPRERQPLIDEAKLALDTS